MAQHPFSSDRDLYAEYERLAAEYKASVIRCHANLDQAQAAGIRLRDIALLLGEDVCLRLDALETLTDRCSLPRQGQ